VAGATASVPASPPRDNRKLRDIAGDIVERLHPPDGEG